MALLDCGRGLIEPVPQNLRWTFFFPEAEIDHLTCIASDHCPLLLSFSRSTEFSLKPFRFEDFWMELEGFWQVIEGIWQSLSFYIRPKLSFENGILNQLVIFLLELTVLKKLLKFFRRKKTEMVASLLMTYLDSVFYLMNITPFLNARKFFGGKS